MSIQLDRVYMIVSQQTFTCLGSLVLLANLYWKELFLSVFEECRVMA